MFLCCETGVLNVVLLFAEQQILTEPVSLQLESTFQVLQQDTPTFRPQLQDFLHPILLTYPHSPATSAYQLVQVLQLTQAISRSCRLKSSACSTVAPGHQQALEGLPPHSRRPTAPLARPPPKIHPAKPCLALLHLDPRVLSPHQAACQSHRVVKDPPALLQVSILITRVYRKPWTLSFRADRLSTPWWVLVPLSSHPPGQHLAWARSRLCPCIPNITD